MGDLIGAIQQLALVETYLGPDGYVKVRDSLRITPSFGVIWYDELDLGFPDVRASVQDNPQSSGTYDETQFTGARAVSLSGKVLSGAFDDAPVLNGWSPTIGWNSSSWWIRLLSAWANPARRIRVYFTDDSELPRFVDVRGDTFSAPIDKTAKDYRAFQIGFTNPSGLIYSFDTSDTAALDGRSVKLIGQGITDGDVSDPNPGRTYPETYPKAYPTPSAAVTQPLVTTDYIDYAGTVPNGFLARIPVGDVPIVNPRLRVAAPDGSVQTIGVTTTIAPGSVVTFDTNERTITELTAAGVLRSLDQFKTAPLQWPTLKPGTTVDGYAGRNYLSYTVTSGPTTANVEVLYYNADLA